MSNKLVQGIGINDSSSAVVKTETVGGKSRQVWMCPFYKRWKDMLKRCYSKSFHRSRPTYKDCVVTVEWHTFSNFKGWMEKQDWEGKVLDKDIFGDGKVYSPATCIFISAFVNVFVEGGRSDKELPLGVCWSEEKRKYRAYGRIKGKTSYLGQSDCPLECYSFWKEHKLDLTEKHLREMKDPSDIKALKEYKRKLLT